MVSPPSSGGRIELYSDIELQQLQKFHTGPGAAVSLPADSHVAILSEQRIVDIEYGLPDGPMPQVFRRVRVLDGQSRNAEGWIISQRLSVLSTATPAAR